jgi:putative ABC transport system ATP-binding protein
MRQSFSSAMPETGPPAALTLVARTSVAQISVALHAVTRVYRSKAGPVTALAGVTASFAAGTFTAVMGPSGSGKSTLLHCAAGLDRPTSGEVILAGTMLRGLSETRLTLLRRRHVGFVFQSFNLLPYLTAGQNVALPLRLAGRRPRRDEIGAALAAVGLDGRAGHRPAELSGGQQQRVAIARALVTGPQVIFADEPTGMLDSASGHEVLSLLRRLADQQQATVVMVTHDPAAAARADRVLFLADGRLAGELADPDPRTVADRLASLTADAGLRTPDGPCSPDQQPAGGWPAQGRAGRGLAGAVR